MTRITVERLREVLHYEPTTGVFTWLVYRGRKAKAGFVAGTTGAQGYRQIIVDGAHYKANCLAWLYMTGKWPTGDVDHRDTDRLNDKWGNLRKATRSQNAANRKRHHNNSSGFKGVHFRKDRASRPWAASIGVNYHRHHLGFFETAQEAHAAYVAAAIKHFGEFARAA
jgi:hypothetical protein